MEKRIVGARREVKVERSRPRRLVSASVKSAVAGAFLTRGERVVAFIERYCRVPEGMHVGKPIVLADFQRKFILDVYDNPHRTSRAFLSIGRKNGKTALIACLVLAHVAGPEARPNSQLVSGAQSRDQAALVFKLALKMVRMSPELSALIRTVPSKKMLIGLALNVEYEALSAEAKTKHGLSPVLAILDETGQVRGPKDDFIDAIVTSQGAHDDPLLICISTQAANDSDMLSLWIDDALLSKDPHTVCHVYSAPKDCSLMDEAAWAAANPGLHLFRSYKDMQSQAVIAQRMPSRESSFRNLNLNQRVETVAPFVSRGVWESCSRDVDDELFTSRPVVGAIDLSGRIDLSSLVMAAAKDDDDGERQLLHLKSYFWTPEDGVVDRAKRDRAPYDLWVKQGHLLTTPGASIDYAFIARFIADLIASGVNFVKIGFDRWRIDLLRKELDRIGVEVELVPFGQGFKDFSPALDEFEDDLMNGRVAHGGHPVLTMCAMNSIVRKDEAGNRKLDKKRSTGRIDGMVAATMAVSLARTSELELDVGTLLAVL